MCSSAASWSRLPSCLDAEDLAALKMRGASPAGPPPAAPAPARAGALPGGTVIEVDRAVDGNGVADLAGHRLKVGAELARHRVTLRLDGHLIHVICDGVLAKTLPSPVPASERGTLGRVDAISADIAALDDRIAAQADPLADAVARLDEIPGISLASAYVVLAEIGTDMARFPTAGHLTSWARLAPGIRESAGKKKGKGSTGHGNIYLARVLGNAAAAAGKTDTFLGERYRRIARRRGSKRAIVAVARSILVIIWHLLSAPDTRYHDLGSGFYAARIDPERRKRSHIHQLEALGYTVTLQPAA
jgi:hypothetical protein